MRPTRVAAIILLSFCVMAGCAGHYYRNDAHGVTFHLRWDGAETVFLLSSLDGFFPHAAENIDGLWVNRLPAKKEFRYFYKVDGKVIVPECAVTEKDDFGSDNCLYMPDL